MDKFDELWIKSLLASGAGAITVDPVSADSLVDAGRGRLARRRRVQAGVTLTAVVGLALTGYAVAAPGGGSASGHTPATVSATTAAARAGSHRPGGETSSDPAPAPVNS